MILWPITWPVVIMHCRNKCKKECSYEDYDDEDAVFDFASIVGSNGSHGTTETDGEKQEMENLDMDKVD